jgi:hypothetical protein
MSAASPAPQVEIPHRATSSTGLHHVHIALPHLWIGYAMAGICALLEAELAYFPPGNDQDIGRIGILYWLTWLGAVVYWMRCIRRIHKILAVATGRTYPISPRKAFWFQMIPIFSVIWNFRMTRQFGKFVESKSSTVRAAKYWPAIFLAVSSLLPAFFVVAVVGVLLGTFPIGLVSAPLAVWFGVVHYLSRKTRQVVEFDIRHVSKKQPIDLAISAALGAGFGFVLIQAIANFFHDIRVDKQSWHEVVAILLVCVAVAKFLEPLFEWLRKMLGVAEESHEQHRQKNLRLQLAFIIVLVFTTMMHGLLHEQINTQLPETGIVLLLALLVSGGTTYCWSLGAQRGRATVHGFCGGLGIAAFALFAVLLSPRLLDYLNKDVLTLRAKGSHSSEQTLAKKGLALPGLLKDSAGSESQSPSKCESASSDSADSPLSPQNNGVNLALIIFAPAIFGLVGGLAIDRKWSLRTAVKTAAGLVLAAIITAAVVTAVVRLFQAPPPNGHPMKHLGVALLWLVFGWWLGLFLHPASDAMLGKPALHVAPQESVVDF